MFDSPTNNTDTVCFGVSISRMDLGIVSLTNDNACRPWQHVGRISISPGVQSLRPQLTEPSGNCANEKDSCNCNDHANRSRAQINGPNTKQPWYGAGAFGFNN